MLRKSYVLALLITRTKASTELDLIYHHILLFETKCLWKSSLKYFERFFHANQHSSLRHVIHTAFSN